MDPAGEVAAAAAAKGNRASCPDNGAGVSRVVSAKGTNLTFAFVMADRVDFASRPVVVRLK